MNDKIYSHLSEERKEMISERLEGRVLCFASHQTMRHLFNFPLVHQSTAEINFISLIDID
jgi:hypothetical protein